ncbi:L-fucose permease [Photobacterium sp. SKA34]|uniref:L-fucose:H+ symporter permease n=1 Tax=Photobacterium sp. SKA34 TaxID=121723 RepID=UPI00006BABD6|nr:L-fucose:H+ symporter permease [Photobacterium sp. SKA34]EAR55684.1 L-fucose permease [Photobacterium sp. SKA34]
MHVNIKESNVNNISTTKKYTLAFATLCVMFFAWGIPNALQNVILPQFQIGFQLSNLQTGFIDSAFYFGYFFVPIIAGIVSNKFGFKVSILIGVVCMAAGTFLCSTSASIFSFGYFLVGLFIIAGGCGFLESSANPLATMLGSKDEAAFRINFAQIFNVAASFLTAIIGSHYILKGVTYKSDTQLATMSQEQVEAYHHSLVHTATAPYFVIAIGLCLIVALVIFTPFPKASDVGSAGESSDGYFKTFKRVMKKPHFKWALIAMFLMNGCQNGIYAFAIRYSAMKLELTPDQASSYLIYVLVGALVGRILGTQLIKRFSPHLVLGYLAILSCIAALSASFAPGYIGVYSLVAAAMFMAIMYPTIFSLGISDLGRDTKIASSFMVMMIVGSVAMVPLMGFIADNVSDFSMAELAPAFGYCVISFFAFKKAMVR